MKSIWNFRREIACESDLEAKSRIEKICRSAGTGFLENLFRDADGEHQYVVRLILVQYLALCGGTKAAQLFSRIKMARSRTELSHLRVACFEEISRQRHQSLAQEMVDLINEASEAQFKNPAGSRWSKVLGCVA